MNQPAMLAHDFASETAASRPQPTLGHALTPPPI